jgi:hypothetical protein
MENEKQVGLYYTSGTTFICMFCGEHTGWAPCAPDADEAADVREISRKHMETCPEHPLAKARACLRSVQEKLDKIQGRLLAHASACPMGEDSPCPAAEAQGASYICHDLIKTECWSLEIAGMLQETYEVLGPPVEEK